jgi:hypothetical protein
MSADAFSAVTRRRALALGGSAAGAMLLGPLGSAQAHRRGHDGGDHDHGQGGGGPTTSLPVDQMQAILKAQGTVTSDGVLSIELDRTDIGTVYIGSVPIKPSFEVNGNLTFQPLSDNMAFFNGDLALKPSEIDPFIDAILANDLIFQAEHQHLYDFNPMVWFIHWRGTGDPLGLAQRVANVVATTSTPLPQSPPANPTTPLDTGRLQNILGADSFQIGSDGVVTYSLSRKEPIYIDGILVSPDANIDIPVAFEPLDTAGKECAVIPDFGMIASEINAVMTVMRGQGWDIGCLYNQETAETPQLYFSHHFNTGDPYQLAAEVRNGLDQMNVS